MLVTLKSKDVERTVGINCRYLGALQNSELGKQDRLFLIEVTMLLRYSVIEMIVKGHSRSLKRHGSVDIISCLRLVMAIFRLMSLFLFCLCVFRMEVRRLDRTKNKQISQ